VFDQFKKWIEVNDVNHNPWHNDAFLLRFCRGRKFDLDAVIAMFSNYMEYRKKNGLDTIVTDYTFTKKAECFPHYPRGYCGVDLIGRPVYIERSGKISPSKLWSIIEEDDMWRSFYQSYEVLNKLHYMACSLTAGKQIQHTFSILDLTGFSIGMMNKRIYALLQAGSKIT